MWNSSCWPWIRHQHTQGCSLDSRLSPPAAYILTVSCRALGVAQVLFRKQRVKHFQSLFYKNKPVLPWYSVAPNLPLCPCSRSLSRSSGCCTPQPDAHTEAAGAAHSCERPQASTRERGLVPFCECLLFPGSKLETARRCLLVALPFLHREQVLGKLLRVHTLRRGVCPSIPLPWMAKRAPRNCFLPSAEPGRLPFRWLAQCWKRGELMWGWWKECVA